MASGNKTLSKAKDAKQDEFYTQLSDIENEMKHYRTFFKDKTVFCNCDDPFESNFFKYFALHFNDLGLKKLIATSYGSSPVAGNEFDMFEDQGQEQYISNARAYKVVMTELKDVTGDGAEDLNDVRELIKHRIRYLNGDGDFRSPESIEMLKEADVVVTNPPFSLFREYVAQLMEYGKHFVIIGNQNAITYKEIFPLLKDNKIWLGNGFRAGNAYFRIPSSADTSRFAKGVYDPSTGLVKFRNCCWFTNIDIEKRHEELILYKHYSPEEYPRYDNYDAIEVSKTADIPMDYDGVMGVPITFLDKYSPEQFEIVGYSREVATPISSILPKGSYQPGGNAFYLKDKTTGLHKRLYGRIAIRRKK